MFLCWARGPRITQQRGGGGGKRLVGLWGGWGRLAAAITGACSHSVKTGGREEVGETKEVRWWFLGLQWWQPPRLKVMCQVSTFFFRHSRWSFCELLFFQLFVFFCYESILYFLLCYLYVHTVKFLEVSWFACIHANMYNVFVFVYMCTYVYVCVSVCRTGWGAVADPTCWVRTIHSPAVLVCLNAPKLLLLRPACFFQLSSFFSICSGHNKHCSYRQLSRGCMNINTRHTQLLLSLELHPHYKA